MSKNQDALGVPRVYAGFVVTPSEVLYLLKGTDVRQARIRRRMTLTSFARKCGWSKSYQHKLEVSRDNYVKTETARAIVESLGHEW